MTGWQQAPGGVSTAVESGRLAFSVGPGSAQPRDSVSGRSLAVLIVEDEPLIAMDLERIVDGAGHRVLNVARTSREAVELARKHRPDLVLCDVHLADGSSGLSASSEIIKETGARVIFITAYPERLLAGDRPLSTLMITKPFSSDDVKTVIAQALTY